MTIVLAQHRRRPNAVLTAQAVLTDLERNVTGNASFVLLPENVFVGADGRSPDVQTQVQALERLKALARARHTWILTGSWPETGVDGVRQVTRMLDPSGSVAIELTRGLEPDGTTSTGEEFPVIDTEHGRVGVLLGPDIWLLEPPRIQCLRGAELLLVASTLSGRTVAAQRAAIWGIASLHAVAVAMAAGIGPGAYGGSGVAMPEGSILEAGSDEGIVSVSWDVARIRELRQPDLRFKEKFWYSLWGRRPDLYGALVANDTSRLLKTGSGQEVADAR